MPAMMMARRRRLRERFGVWADLFPSMRSSFAWTACGVAIHVPANLFRKPANPPRADYKSQNSSGQFRVFGCVQFRVFTSVLYLVAMSESDDFAALFEKSLKTKPVHRGQSIEGTIVAINAKGAFVDIGGKGEATIDIAELKNEDGTIDVKVGDRVHAVVTATDGGVTISRRLARGAATNRQLEDAYRAGLTVEGKVEREV